MGRDVEPLPARCGADEDAHARSAAAGGAVELFPRLVTHRWNTAQFLQTTGSADWRGRARPRSSCLFAPARSRHSAPIPAASAAAAAALYSTGGGAALRRDAHLASRRKRGDADL